MTNLLNQMDVPATVALAAQKQAECILAGILEFAYQSAYNGNGKLLRTLTARAAILAEKGNRSMFRAIEKISGMI